MVKENLLDRILKRSGSMLAAFTGVKKAVLCVNGTAALHICLKMSGFSPNRPLRKAITGSICSFSKGNMRSKEMKF